METGLPENAHMHAAAYCPRCGYALRGLPGNICPECGSLFDRALLARPGHVRNAGLKWLSRPTPWWWVASCTVAAVGVWLAASDVPSFKRAVTKTVWLALLFALCLSAGARLATREVLLRRRPPCERARDTRCHRRMIAVLGCFIVGILAVATDWPLRVRFALSRPAMERAVRDINRGTWNANRPRYVGLFRIRSVYSGASRTNGIYFEVDHDFANYVGFVYRRTGGQRGQRLDARWSLEWW